MYNYAQLGQEQIEYVAVAAVEELPAGERLFVQIDQQPLIVFNIGGQYFAIGDVCSHDGNILDDAPLEGWEVVCPRHGAHFDIRTGKVMALPAVEDIPAFPVRVVDGQIEVGMPAES